MMRGDDELLAQDEAHRSRALELYSFIVEAPAGAGKTELLTQRYLRLLATVDEPEEVVAITFTNKAAGEMRQRIADSLSIAREATPPPAAHKRVTFELARSVLARAAERDWQLDAQPGRLRLTTIDALCASLMRQMPVLSRFGAQPGFVEDAGRHYEEAARRAVDHLDAGDELADAVAVALAHLDNDGPRLIALLAAMLARREQWRPLWRADIALDHPESLIAEALQALVDDEMARAEATLDAAWQASWMPLARFAASNSEGGALADWRAPLAASTDDMPRWLALAELLLTRDDEARRTVNKNNGFPAGKEFKATKDAMLAALGGLAPEAVAALRRLRQLPVVDIGDPGVVRALVRLLKLAAAELWLVFREAGEVDFVELSSRAIAALGDDADPSELALRLDYRIRHLLVDEFQDTSPTQIDLLARLTAGWQPGDGRTLFVVGDPMQSVYRFRKADVGLFLRAAEEGIGAVPLTLLRLSRNNRSDPAVVDWINARFPPLFPAQDAPLRGEIRYRSFVATRDAEDDAGVFVHPRVVDGEEDKAIAANREAEAVVDIVAAEWRADPQRRIAVLARARAHLAAIAAALRRRGWRFAAVDIEPLAGRQVVQDLIALTRALHHRADRVNWLAILRAPWCGLRLADLHALAADDHAATVWSLMNDPHRVARLSADGQARLAHVRAVCAEALDGQGRQRRRRWVEDAWKKLGGPRCTDARGLADAAAFFTRLDQIDAAGRFDADGLEDDMGRLFAGADAQADGRLQLMTVHKAKGLEFDTVILPGLHRPPAGRNTRLLAWDSFPLEGGERLVAAPVNRRRARGAQPTAYDFLQRLEREREANEEARVLYVAATRAIRRLHLVGVAVRGEDAAGGAASKPPRAGSALARLWPALSAEFDAAAAAAPAVAAFAEDGLASFAPGLIRLRAPAIPAAWQAPPVPAPVSFDERTAEPLAAAIGTLAHACLEQIVAAPAAWTQGVVRARRPAFERWLASRGWDGADASTGAARVAAMLETTLASADGQWVLAAHDDGAAELALTKVSLGGTAATRVMDRCFVADGVRWIVDYKTADLGAGADDAAFARHAERYRAQLEEYGGLLAGEGLPLRLAVFYVSYGKLVTVG